MISGHGQLLLPLTEDDDGDESKRKTIYRLWAPPMEFRDVIRLIKKEQREKHAKYKEEYHEITKGFNKLMLRREVRRVRKENIEIAEEEKKMKALEDKQRREERREAVRKAREEAIAAALKERDEELAEIEAAEAAEAAAGGFMGGLGLG